MPADQAPIPVASTFLTLQSGDSLARIALTGAEPLVWRVAERDLLWTPDPAYWSATSPILFPLVGWARNGEIRVDGRTYPMGVHGFAASKTFDVVARSANAATLRLRNDPATHAGFPFHFMLDVTYRLDQDALISMFDISNPGTEPLPYALGVHPGFCWPFAGGAQSEYSLHFPRDERAEVPIIAPDGLFSREARPIPLKDRTLPLSPELFAREALCLLHAASPSLSFAHKDGAAIELICEDFPHFAFWTKPGAPYLCLEAWTGHGDPVGFTGDIREKPSMRLLAPGDVARHAVTFRYHAPVYSNGHEE
ncbi:aldose 1-epimerase family protein [Methylovirgula sp. 4M-Z18]|uniref:aldose 1-epimerase family protein n=1 Tax=Methylovirgula sp. 4M-Z18 TaxID=2293567 RepID=UPI000E2F60B4|nr:aldose 1-epimerase family protein [Methylovirgula sp. 4M-Z18]RFB81605.1 aldose 1-epimerase family protein [Methylovirgula sp. 4M-Z18]